jgi:hypothetical protein
MHEYHYDFEILLKQKHYIVDFFQKFYQVISATYLLIESKHEDYFDKIFFLHLNVTHHIKLHHQIMWT